VQLVPANLLVRLPALVASLGVRWTREVLGLPVVVSSTSSGSYDLPARILIEAWGRPLLPLRFRGHKTKRLIRLSCMLTIRRSIVTRHIRRCWLGTGLTWVNT
jgi:hypothetical protein